MNNSIRKYKNSDELINELIEEKKLFFPDENSKQIFKAYLIEYGYVSFVKKMSSDLMYDNKKEKTYKKEFTSNNLRYLFDIDRNISSIIFKYFRNIEFFLNSSLLKVIAKNLNKYVNCPYISSLNIEAFSKIFPNINNNISIKKRNNKHSFIIFYEDIFKNFNNIDFNCKEAIEKNKNYENPKIKDLIEKGWFKEYIYKNLKSPIKGWEYLDIFSLFQILTFSQLVRIFSYLSTSSKHEVIKEFFNYFSPKIKKLKLKENSFNYLIKLFSSLRNVLMHNGCLIKFNFEIDDETKNNFEKYFNLSLETPNIKLNEAIFIIESIINIKDQIFMEINQSVEHKIKNRNERPDKVSKIVFDIIEKESGIKINYDSIKDKIQ